MSDSSYGLTTFSASGKLVQIDYANNAVNKGHISLGIKAQGGCVLAAEKRTSSPLIDASSVQKVFVLDEHVGCTYSGIGPDSRVLVDGARKSCQQYRRMYNEPMPIGQVVREIAGVFQEYTQSGGVRPFGVSLLIAGVDTTGFHLYQVDPSGTYLAWKATAIGKNSTNARTFLEKRYSGDMELEDATHTALLTLKEGFDGRMTQENIVVGRVVGSRFEILSEDQLKDYLDQI